MTKELANGMQVLMLKGAANGCVNTSVFYAVGGGDEAMGKSGIAHFLEHLSFKSTLDFGAGEFDKALKALGANNNACTSSDYTQYYAHSAKEHSTQIMQYFASMMDRLAFKQDEFDAEKLVVLEEERLSVANNPFGKLWFRLHNEAYKNTPLASSVIGFADEISALSMDDVMSFYRRHYAPNNALLVLSGDINEELLQSAEEIFGNKSRVDLPPRSEKIYANTKPIKVVEEFVDLGADIFAIAWRIPSFNHEDFVLLEAFSKYLNLEHSSPLIRKFVHEKALCCELEAYAHASRHEGLFIIFGTCCEGVDAQQITQQIAEDIYSQPDLAILDNFIALEQAECLASFSSLSNELGTAWAMGDLASKVRALSFKCNNADFSKLKKYFNNEISIILKEDL